MKVSAATSENIRYVAERMRVRDRTEFAAVAHTASHEDMVRSLVQGYQNHPDAFCFSSEDDEPVAIAALVQARPNVITLLFFATDQMPVIGAALTRFVVQRLFPKYRKFGVHRIECASAGWYGETHRWLKSLGLQREAEMPGYGRGGETYVQFAWVAEDVRTSSA